MSLSLRACAGRWQIWLSGKGLRTMPDRHYQNECVTLAQAEALSSHDTWKQAPSQSIQLRACPSHISHYIKTVAPTWRMPIKKSVLTWTKFCFILNFSSDMTKNLGIAGFCSYCIYFIYQWLWENSLLSLLFFYYNYVSSIQ